MEAFTGVGIEGNLPRYALSWAATAPYSYTASFTSLFLYIRLYVHTPIHTYIRPYIRIYA